MANNSGSNNSGSNSNNAQARVQQGERTRRSAIIAEPAVVKRLSTRSSIDKITSNGTIAAAVMVMAALLAVVVANSPAYEIVHEVLEARLTFTVGPITMGMSVEAFVNDFLMAIFFLLVGIELKYEMTVGQLRYPRQAALPMLAAVGGVAVPALIYTLFNWGRPSIGGWAIPIATDIAFALGVMSLLGDRVAPETKVFFQTLAIADDILAIVVLALFYGQSPNIAWCAASLAVILVLAALSWAKVYTARWYILVGLFLWVCMYNSGIHATLAGVILAFFLPARSDVRLGNLRGWLATMARDLEDKYDDEAHVLGQHDFTHAANLVERVMHHVTPPLERVERDISVTVNFLILPLFAFTNAQVRLVGVDLGSILADPVARGAFLGAVLGKPIGIVAVTVLLVRIGFARLPNNVTWSQIIAVGIMGGMGFTMSILISGLAFHDPNEVLAAKCAILAGSVVAGVTGLVFVMAHDALTGGSSSPRPRER
ncbi:MAG: Na+/H+ antiporter NhaA [Atopobiaceae bacterium]|nr:Na+/H+ antiporter NhaA [Atopobiaceae bacterium]